tara:strand:+ start:218 stop:457 length:240 start_codon:yes stop_codon:yes gene_type:complete
VSKIIGLIVIGFFLIGGYMIYDNLDTDFDDSDDRIDFFKTTGMWIFNVGKATKNTVGYAIDQEWLPNVNSSNSTILELD